MNRIPLWVKLGYTAFLLAWAAYYVSNPAGWDFKLVIWFCYVGLFVMGAALWLENPLLASWQAVSLVLVQLVFTLDVSWRLVLGKHLMDGWTDYMFDPGVNLFHRWLSWFHTPMPFLILWVVWRLGYDRRALYVQTAAAWVLLLLAYFFTDPDDNVNQVYGPTVRQTLLPSWAYLLFCLVAYPLALYLPMHLLFVWLMPSRERVEAKSQSEALRPAMVPSTEIATAPE